MENEYEEVIDSTIDTEETVQPEELVEEETLETEPEIDIAQLQATNKKLYERAKKAEAEVKSLKNTPAPKTVKPVTASPQSNIEEVVLLANGMDEELLEKLKKVSQVNGTSLIKAQSDPIFIAVKEKFESDKKKANASMPASRGSSPVKTRKDFKSVGLTEAEHRAMVQNLNL